MEWVCSPKFYGPLTTWPWLKISPQSSLNVIYYLIISAWQWLMSFIYTPCTPMPIKPNKSPLRNRFLVLLLWEMGHLSSPSRSCLGRLILICGGWCGPAGVAPPPTTYHPVRIFKNGLVSLPEQKPRTINNLQNPTWSGSLILPCSPTSSFHTGLLAAHEWWFFKVFYPSWVYFGVWSWMMIFEAFISLDLRMLFSKIVLYLISTLLWSFSKHPLL